MLFTSILFLPNNFFIIVLLGTIRLFTSILFGSYLLGSENEDILTRFTGNHIPLCILLLVDAILVFGHVRLH